MFMFTIERGRCQKWAELIGADELPTLYKKEFMLSLHYIRFTFIKSKFSQVLPLLAAM
jgi:hypothetical protein